MAWAMLETSPRPAANAREIMVRIAVSSEVDLARRDGIDAGEARAQILNSA